MGFQALQGAIGGRRTAIGIAAQDLRERERPAGQRLAIGHRPTVQPFRHDLDPPAHAQILDADLAQGEVEMTKHGIEERLRQAVPVGLPPQAVDGEGGMKRQSIEPTVQRVGNAAAFVQIRLARLFGNARVEGFRQFFFDTLATKQDRAPSGHRRRLTGPDHRDMLCTLFIRNPSPTPETIMRRFASCALAGALLLPALAGCDAQFYQRGFVATPGSVEKLEVGAQSREDVVRLIGTPSAVSTFNPNVWYFISETQEAFAFLKPEITQQKVIQITFNDSGRISAIKNYDLADARDIVMVQRTTPTSGKELTVLEQILGNVGKFNPASKQTGGPGAPTSGI